MPINPYTGNATRTVADLAVPSVGEIPLQWMRYNNTRVTAVNSYSMGSEGNWRHSYQWDFSYTAAIVSVVRSPWVPPVVSIPYPSDGKGRITIVYPDGTTNLFKETAVFSGVFVCASSEVTDYVVIDGAYSEDRRANYYNDYTNFRLVTSSNHRFCFGKNGTSFFLNSIVDSKNQSTLLAYETVDGRRLLDRVTEPGGRYLDLTYQAYRYTVSSLGTGSAQTYTDYNISKVTSSDNREVSYSYGNRVYSTRGSKAFMLSSVTYPDTRTAQYTYQPHVATAQGASLLTARDISSNGIPNIKYTFWGAVSGYSPPPVGSVQNVKELDSDAVICSLGLVATENDPNALVVSFTDGAGFGYFIKPSSGGLLQQATNISDNSSSVSYSTTAGSLTTTNTNPAGKELTITRSSLGRITSKTYPKVYGQANNPTETWTYDDEGYLLTFTDTLSHTITITRDANHLPTRITYPDSTFEAFTYGAFNQVATHRLRNGGTRTLTYFGATEHGGAFNGMLKSSQDASGRTITYTYDAHGRTATVTDSANRTTNFEYDINGRMIKMLHPPLTPGATRAYRLYTYDSRGNNISSTDELGKTWRTSFDTFNRPLSTTDPLDRVTTFIYDANSPLNRNPVEVVSPVGRRTVTTYTQGWSYQPATVTVAYGTPEAATTNYAYDVNGKVIKMTDPRGHFTTFGYDERERVSYAIDPAGNRSEFTYDDASNLKVELTPDGQTTHVYDEMDRPTRSTDPKGQVINITYNALDQIASYSDPKNQVYSYQFDIGGRPTSTTYPDATTEAFTYDTVGNVATVKARDGKVQTFTYDGWDRQTVASWNDGLTPSVNSGYDAAGRLTSISNSNSSIAYDYNNADELISETQTLAGMAAPKAIGYSYNSDGDLQSLTYPDGTALGYTYDPRGLLTSIKQGTIQIAGFTYDQAGSRLGRNLQNGVNTTLTYDNVQRLTSIKDVGPGATSLQRFDYGYDAMSRRKYSKKANGLGDVYGYDTSGQLASVKYDAQTPDVVPANAQRTVIYAHDAAGNRTGITDTVAGEVTPCSLSYVSNINNQYSSVGFATLGYDGRGNLASYSEGGTNSTRRINCSYDSENRLLSATNNFDSTGLTQAYDPLGRCVKRIENGITTYFVHDQSWHLLAEYDANGVQKTRYVGGSSTDEMISRTDAGGATFYYHTDGLGSVTGLTNTSGQLVETYSYDIYGNPTIKDAQGQKRWTSALGNRFLFTGREYLYSLGVYDYRARIYDPYLGRFWQPDPIGHSGDESNIYRYCGNDPVNHTDPSGLASFFYSVPYSNIEVPWVGVGGDNFYFIAMPPIPLQGNFPPTWGSDYSSASSFHGSPAPFAGGILYRAFGASMHEEARKEEFKEQSTWRKVSGVAPVAAESKWSWGEFGLGAVEGLASGLVVGVAAAAIIATGPIGLGIVIGASVISSGVGLYQWHQSGYSIDSRTAGRVAGGLVAGGITAKGFVTGKEFGARNFRVAPWGNRGNLAPAHPTGKYPHYHRAQGHSNPRRAARGEVAPGQGIKRHRPWDVKPEDSSFNDRF